MLVREPARLSLKGVQWRARSPRATFMVVCAVLSLLGLRSLTAARPAASVAAPARVIAAPDGFAEGFARAYLTSPGSEQQRDAALKVYGYAADSDPGGPVTRRSLWTAAVADQAGSRGDRVVTVLADDGRNRWYLAVTVATDRAGRRYVPVAPALVGAPAVPPRPVSPAELEVDDPSLRQVVSRMVRHYLAGDASDLAADLAPRAAVTLPPAASRAVEVGLVTWVSRPTRVAVAVTIAGLGGTQLALRYELQVVRVGGRWLVRSVQVNPLDGRETR